MAESASSGGVLVTSTGEDTGPSSVITELMASWDDFQLLQLTDFYRNRLGQAMEGGVHGVSLALTAENQVSGEEHLVSASVKDVQQKHKEKLRGPIETLSGYVLQLLVRYAELTVISTVRDRRLVEHELLARGRDHGERRQKPLRRELEKIRTDQLFQSGFSSSKSKSGCSAVVAGITGIGKTTMVEQIVSDWAAGTIYQHFQFVFSFKFRDLSNINSQKSLRELILKQYPHFDRILEEVWKNPEGLLFIFDGFDEFNEKNDFDDSWGDTKPQLTCTDPEIKCKLSAIVHSLIQHKLLQGCSVLVTTRLTALHLLKKAGISVWAEMLAFSGEERKEYFIKHVEGETVAAAVFKHVEENEILHSMSYNPLYCRVLALTLGPFFARRDRYPQPVPKTITQLYSYYISNILENHDWGDGNPRDTLLRIGQMAFKGVSENKVIFTNEDIIENRLEHSGFPMELLKKEKSAWAEVYTFPHFTIQVFVAAVAQFLKPHRGGIRKFLIETQNKTDVRFELLLRFVAGLSSPVKAPCLEEFLGPFSHQTTCRVINWLEEEVKRKSGNTSSVSSRESLLNTLHYLFEAQNSDLDQAALRLVKKLSFSGMSLTPIDCAVLSHVIGICDTIKHLDLDSVKLESALHKCQELSLGLNNLGDSVVKLVSAALRNPESKVQKLWLFGAGLTADGAMDLISTLSANRSLTELSLSGNKLGDSGVKLVSAALRISECKLQKLWLRNVCLTDSGAEDVASTLSTNRSLTELDLSGNKLRDSGVKQVSAALKNSGCKIQKLWLYDVGLTANGAEDLASALSTNRSLTELSLSANKLGDSGVKLVSDMLRNSECRIQKLWLCNVGLTDSAAGDLASALGRNASLTVLSLNNNKLGDLGVKLVSAALIKSACKLQESGSVMSFRVFRYRRSRSVLGATKSLTELNMNFAEGCCSHKFWCRRYHVALRKNRSLTELNLGANTLGDSGVKLIAEALRYAECKIQKLWLRDVGLTDSGAKYLDSALSTKPSLTELSLNDNKLGDSGVKQVSAALMNPQCNIQKLWLRDVGLTAYGAKDLANTLGAKFSMTELNLGGNKLGDSGVKLVSDALWKSKCKIQKLWLWNVGLTDSAAGDLASVLCKSASLTVLSLNNNKLGDSGVKQVSVDLIKSGCTLQELGLCNVGVTDSGTVYLASALSTNPTLTELNLNDNKLGDSGGKLISEALRISECKIQKLWLRDACLTDSGAEHLASALSTKPSLTELNLGGNKLRNSGVKLVSAALRKAECKIQKLWLWNVGLTDSVAGDLASALGRNASLMVLSLNNNKLGDSGVKLVSAALMKSGCKLQEWGLRNVGLTDSGAEDLASALRAIPSLTELNLNDNKLGDAGVKLVSEALRNPEYKIQKLWLMNVGLTSSGAKDLAATIRTKPSLTELNLGGNKLGDSGVKLVSAALRNSECKIQKLWLSDVGLTDSGAEDLISTLNTNPSLSELSLNDNKLGDSRVKLVSAALRVSECKLQKLCLGEVGLTDYGAEDLVSALTTNPSLAELDLRFNSLTDRSVLDLRRLILTLPCLDWIELVRNQFSETGMEELQSLQQRRRGMRVTV